MPLAAQPPRAKVRSTAASVVRPGSPLVRKYQCDSATSAPVTTRPEREGECRLREGREQDVSAEPDDGKGPDTADPIRLVFLALKPDQKGKTERENKAENLGRQVGDEGVHAIQFKALCNSRFSMLNSQF